MKKIISHTVRISDIEVTQDKNMTIRDAIEWTSERFSKKIMRSIEKDMILNMIDRGFEKGKCEFTMIVIEE